MDSDKQSIILAILTGSAFILLFGFFVFLVLLSFVKRKRKLLHDQEIRESQFQQELLQAQLEMQEHTFKTISQEIHDNVGQILSLAKVNLNIVTMDEKAPERLHDIKTQVTSAITELRNLSMGYYADRIAEKGLLAAIQYQLQQLDKTGLFTTSFESTVDHVSMDKNKTIFLYRMVQEALNNALKHSGGDHIAVKVYEQNDEVHILLRDNGKGFSTKGADFKPGIGLSSMQQRAAMINARIEVTGDKEQGTTVHLVCKPSAYD
jgi:signal transduction histidine kinase